VTYDVVVVGGGINGLVAAAYLSRAGLKVLVCERHDRVGGCAATDEIAPGVRAPILAHRAALDAVIARELELGRHGLVVLPSPARACGIADDGRALVVWNDIARTARDIRAFSAADADRYPEFVTSLRATTAVLADVLSTPAPDIDSPSLSDLMSLFQTSRRFRSLGKTDAYRLLRWMPMPVADFAAEWFESEPLRATVAADGLLGSFLGPRSAGSTAVLLALASRDQQPIASGWTARGGPGAIAAALVNAARERGATIRTNAAVTRILVNAQGAQGVVLENGEELRARVVLSGLDPRRTLLGLVDPAYLDPTFRHHASRIRMRGVLTKVNYLVSEAPSFAALRTRPVGEQHAALSGAIRLAAHTNDLERAFDAAKYGGLAEKPVLEVTVPSLLDDSLTSTGHHVVSVYAQFTPYDLRDSTWVDAREPLADLVTRAIDTHAPGFAASVIVRQVLTPVDLERTWGLTGGHIFHGELALDQLFLTRPLLGWSRYRTPIPNLFLCGSGTHPGIGIDGRSGRLAARDVFRIARQHR
jgi:phytoene dehydrogenase-like protein